MSQATKPGVRVGSQAVANWGASGHVDLRGRRLPASQEGLRTARVADDPGAVGADVAVRRAEPDDLPLGVLGGLPTDRAGGTCGPIRG
jgi:hypothetical protein